MSIYCTVFDVDVSSLTSQQLKERCAGCLEHTGGTQCSHLTVNNINEQLKKDYPIQDDTWPSRRYNEAGEYVDLSGEGETIEKL